MKIEKKKIIIGIIIFAIIYHIMSPYIGRRFVSSKIDRNSVWYVNDLYMSDQYYYDNLLNDNEKDIYLKLFEATKNYEESITVNCDVNTAMKIGNAISIDHPELIYLAYYKYWQTSPVKVEIKYLTTDKTKVKRMVAQIQKIITEVEKNTRNILGEYEKELYVYEWLGNNNKYRRNYVDRSDQSAYSALMSGKTTVCAGYGRAAQILFQNIGIKSYIMLSSDHLWNEVCIDGDYYYFDATYTYVTNCNKTISYSGLNPTNVSNYYPLYSSVVPELNGTKYNYYEYNDLIISDVDELEKIIEKTNNTIDKIRCLF